MKRKRSISSMSAAVDKSEPEEEKGFTLECCLTTAKFPQTNINTHKHRPMPICEILWIINKCMY